MLVAMLAFSGARVVIPAAVQVVPAEDERYVHFVDANGTTLVTFERRSISLFWPPEHAPPLGAIQE